ncbi:MAG: hypothetical protein ACJAS1_005332 [Oleiphilaceae bacterium]|jgi:hypothetical protein
MLFLSSITVSSLSVRCRTQTPSIRYEPCHQVQAWLGSGLPAITVVVNISALEFKHYDFLKGIKNTLKSLV